MANESDDARFRTLTSAIATVSLAHAFMLDELKRLSPDAAQRVINGLDTYARHVESKHGCESSDAQATRLTLGMLTRVTKTDGNAL